MTLISPTSPDIRVHVASINTRHATELCVRSAREFAGCPFELVVGDGGSSDCSLNMLRQLEGRGWLQLEVARDGRGHAEWLEHWLDACEHQYAVFVDSDVEFVGKGWLTDLIATARKTQAALVCAEMLPGGVRYVHPLDGTVMELAARPSPWLFLLDATQTRGIDAGFGWMHELDPRAHGGMVAYDVGAAFLRALGDRERTWAAMPAEFQRKFRHFGGLSWKPQGWLAPRQAFKLAKVRWRLLRARLRGFGWQPEA